MESDSRAFAKTRPRVYDNRTSVIMSPMVRSKRSDGSGRLESILSITALAIVWGSALAAFQLPAAQKSSEQVFKNIQVMKGVPVDDFLGSMGLMCAALGYDCSDCHTGAGTEKVDWAADTPEKVRARVMVRMMQAINRDNFGGRQMVTCWSCHHGRDHPATTPSLEYQYGPATQEMDDVLTQMPGQPAAEHIIDKYIEAIGGSQRVAGLKSYVAQGTSVGFGGFGGAGRVEIFARFPDQRATWIDFPESPQRGRTMRLYNGMEGWLETPLTVLGKYQLTGGELDGARLDAQLSFPAQITQALSNLRVSMPVSISDLPAPSSQTSKNVSMVAIGQDRLVNVVQGTGPRGILANLYFDQQSGLLLRVVRYGRSPIGRVPTQVDFGDYHEVSGIKMPFHLVFAWMDGRDAIQLSDIQINPSIDASKFTPPDAAGGR